MHIDDAKKLLEFCEGEARSFDHQVARLRNELARTEDCRAKTIKLIAALHDLFGDRLK